MELRYMSAPTFIETPSRSLIRYKSSFSTPVLPVEAGSQFEYQCENKFQGEFE